MRWELIGQRKESAICELYTNGQPKRFITSICKETTAQKDEPLIVPIYVIRTGLMTSTYPLNESILMDFVPKKKRARWKSHIYPPSDLFYSEGYLRLRQRFFFNYLLVKLALLDSGESRNLTRRQGARCDCKRILLCLPACALISKIELELERTC